MDSVVITNQGLEAIRQSTGELRIVINSLAIGRENYLPSQDQSSLRSEIDRLDILELKSLGGGRLSFSSVVELEEDTSIGEIGLILESGEIFCIISNPERELARYYIDDTHVFSYSLSFQEEAIPNLIIEIENTNFTNLSALINLSTNIVSLARSQLATGLMIRDKQLLEAKGGSSGPS